MSTLRFKDLMHHVEIFSTDLYTYLLKSSQTHCGYLVKKEEKGHVDGEKGQESGF